MKKLIFILFVFCSINSIGQNFFWSYNNTPSATVPIVITASVTITSSTTASGGGNVTADGGASVTARGVCWNTSTNPTVANSHTSNGTGTGSFTSSITGLTDGTTYYVRAYATNSAGMAYGSSVSFTAICTRPGGLMNLDFYTTVNGVAISTEADALYYASHYSCATTCYLTTNQSLGGENDMVYLYDYVTNCNTAPDRYYVMRLKVSPWTTYPVYVSSGILHYVSQ